MKLGSKIALTLVALGFAAAPAWFWWARPAPVIPAATAPPQPAPAQVAAAPPAASSGIQHPIENLQADPAAAPVDLPSAVTGLFGREAVLALFQMNDLPHRVAATVDGLGREQASPRLWPLSPAAGRFTVERHGDGDAIGADNGQRYTPYVLLLEAVDLRQAVALYAAFYPQFQQAYEDLGYPGGYFNDRLVAVIDQLLLAPDPAAPIGVHLPTVNSPVQPTRPWVLYEFNDPALQALSAGQRLTLRTGPVNERRIKARLRELRRLLAPQAAASAPR